MRWTPLTRYRLRTLFRGVPDVQKDSAVRVSGGGTWVSIAFAVRSPEEAAAFEIGGLATDNFM